MEEIQDHCYLPHEWSSNKCHSKSCVIVHEIAKDPRVTSKQLKAFFTLANVNVHNSTFGRTLNNHVQATVARRNPLLSKKEHRSTSAVYWRSCGQPAIGEMFCGRMRPKYTFWFKWEASCLEKEKYCIPA